MLAAMKLFSSPLMQSYQDRRIVRWAFFLALVVPQIL